MTADYVRRCCWLAIAGVLIIAAAIGVAGRARQTSSPDIVRLVYVDTAPGSEP